MGLKSRTALKTLRDSLFPDNSTGYVTPSRLRQFLDDLIDSDFNITDDTDGEGIVATSVVDLSSSDILSLNSTPIQLVAAPGTGKIITPISISARLNFGSSAYAANVNMRFGYDSPVVSVLSTNANLLAATEDAFFLNYPTDLYSIESLNDFPENLGFYVQVETGNPTTGNGTVRISVSYILQDIS